MNCLYQLISNEFRTVNLSDPVDQLVEQISLFHLTDLTQLMLGYKNLTGDEMVRILVATEARGATLTSLAIYDNFADADMKSLSNYLKTSKVQAIHLGCADELLPGGTGLTNQGLQYLINVLTDTQINYMELCFPNIDNIGIIQLANQLNTTKINRFFLLSANIDDNGGQSLAQALATIPIYQILLSGSKIGDGTILALANVINNNPLLTELWISGGHITDEGAKFYAQMIQNSSLNAIGLISTNITDQGVVALTNSLKNLPALTNAFAIGSQCGEQGIIALAQQLNQTNFWLLQLMGNSFTPTSMKEFSTALPSTMISELQLLHQQLNNETMTQLAQGINYSFSIDTLIFDNSEFSGSFSILASSIQKVRALQIRLCNLTNNDIITLAYYLPGSVVQQLYLLENNIGDAGVIALARVLPYTNIIALSLDSNNITDVGAQALHNVYRSTKLQALFLGNNNISSQLLSKIEHF